LTLYQDSGRDFFDFSNFFASSSVIWSFCLGFLGYLLDFRNFLDFFGFLYFLIFLISS